MKPTHYLRFPVIYRNNQPGASCASVTLPVGTAVEYDGRAPNGMARVFLPAMVVGNAFHPLPMLVIPFNVIEVLP